jgi:hypothetical protein
VPLVWSNVLPPSSSSLVLLKPTSASLNAGASETLTGMKGQPEWHPLPLILGSEHCSRPPLSRGHVYLSLCPASTMVQSSCATQQAQRVPLRVALRA